MKVLFAAADRTPDFSAAYLWDGLQTLLGRSNVADATDGHYLRGNPKGGWGNDRPIRHFYDHRIPQSGEDDFDVLVATTTFLRDHNWHWLEGVRDSRLKKGGKVVWYETLDSPGEIFAPQIPVDAVFRREIDPAIQYPYGHKPIPLLAAIPERWFGDLDYGWTEDKPYDIFHVSNAQQTGHPTRWDCLPKLFQTRYRYACLSGSSGVLQPNWIYLHLLRKFKFVINAPGGGISSDNSRCWESVACGTINIFVGQPCRPRWPWWTGEHAFWCETPDQLPDLIERALGADLPRMRRAMRAHALQWHTTEARARQLLDIVACDGWQPNVDGPWRW